MRDKKLRLLIMGPPIFMLIIFGYAVNTDVEEVSCAILDRDRSATSRELIRHFTASPYFSWYADVPSSRQAVEMLDSGKIDLFINIEKDFARKIKTGGTGTVQAILDGSDSTRASVIQSYVNGVVSGFTRKHMESRIRTAIMRHDAGQRVTAGTVDIRERIFFNQDLTSTNFYLPGVIGLLIALVTIMLTSMSIVKEREIGTIEQINVSPLHPFEFIMGKLVPFAMVAFVDIIIVTVLAILWFSVPFRGSFLFLLASGLLFILSTLAVGLFISTISRTQQQAMLSSFLFFIPAILLSGFIFPIYSMPGVIQLTTFFNPLRYFISIARGVFLKGTGPAVLWPDLLLMTALSLALLFLSVKRYSKRME